MKKLPLLPHIYQRVGFLLFIPFLLLSISYAGWDYEIPWLSYSKPSQQLIDFNNHNFTDELALAGLIVSLLLISFSKEKIEDEAIQFFRLASLQWAVLVNYLILILCVMLVYGSGFLSVILYNMFTVLVIFIVRFRFVLYQHNKSNP
jgi:membrane protein CcdC involved in cytochrome C biogenesis